MTCTAILVNYHGATDIAAAVESIIADDPQTGVVVVDNSCDAAEHARLRALLAPQVQVVDALHNLGFGKGCNLGWTSSVSDHVFLVNPDVRLLPGCIHALSRALDADPTLAAVAPQQFLDAQCRWHMPPAWFPTAVRAWAHEKALRDPGARARMARAAHAESVRLWTANQPLTQRALSGSALMLRRSAFATGEVPFDPRFFMYFEDSDLCARLRRRGQGMAVVPSARAVHAWRNLPHKGVLMEEAARVYFDKHYPHDHRWLYKARHMGPLPADGKSAFCAAVSPRLPVPPALQAGWVLELSPSRLLQPSVGMLGAGAMAVVDEAVLACFEGAPVYGRLSGRAGLADAQEWVWTVPRERLLQGT